MTIIAVVTDGSDFAVERTPHAMSKCHDNFFFPPS